jgi:hypothetical protein
MQSDGYRRHEDNPTMSETALSPPRWMILHPVSIIAPGNPEQAVERLLTLQSAISRMVHLATTLGQLRLSRLLRGAPRPRLR